MIPVKVEKNMLKPINNRKDENAYKGTFGKAYLICGSVGMCGAAVLSAKSAVVTGAGLVTVSSVKSNYSAISASIPEVMQKPLKETDDGRIKASSDNLEIIKNKADNSNAVLFGCGIGLGEDAKIILKELLKSDCKKVIIDADGINALNGDIDILCSTNKDIIITPHYGEMARLLNLTIKEVIDNRLKLASSLAQKCKITVVLKGHEPITASKTGGCVINTTGNCGMGKGGSGDVLAGIITSLCAQGFDADFSAFAGVYLHGLAGDIGAEIKTKNCLIPSDIIDYLPNAFKKVL
jgi:NAD(P)H-hydrate epimerase